DCFDRRDLAALDVSEECLARAHRLTIQVHGACTTKCLPAAEFRSFETQEISNGPEQGHAGVDPLQDPLLSVHRELHRAQPSLPSMWSQSGSHRARWRYFRIMLR